VLLTGPFGGLTDDVREFLPWLADDGLPLTGWGGSRAPSGRLSHPVCIVPANSDPHAGGRGRWAGRRW
jgi:hypothetical protein